MADRDLTLSPRKESTRDKIAVEIFSNDEIEKHFNENVTSLVSQFDVAENLVAEGKTESAKDIWRSQIVFLESAFDFYIHEIIKQGIMNIYHGDWSNKTLKYHHLVFDMDCVERAIRDTEDDMWLKDRINELYKSETMMSYERFKDVCNLIGLNIKEIADAVFYEPGSTEKTDAKLHRELDRLYERRNQIAHQSDRRHENAEKQDISEQDVKDSINIITEIVHACGKQIRKMSE